MSIAKLASWKIAAIAATAAAALATSSVQAGTKTTVVCNQWNECWRIKEHIVKYPDDVRIVYHDDSWWAEHEHDTQWRELPDPSDDNGWYDKDGAWHAFASPPPQP